jgi:histidinol-phosphate phosphatase family protein
MLQSYIYSYLEDLKWTVDELDRSVLAAVVDVLQRARAEGRQVLLIGNGGSAAAASHIACDLGKDNTALMTAIGNDISFAEVFREQLRIVMRDGDVVVLISASGSSPNVLRAAEYARSRGATTIGLIGFGGGELRSMVDHALVVSSRNYGISEDFHLVVQHIFTQYLRRVVSGPGQPVAFLDRDGIINERLAADAYVERWDQFRLEADAVPALLELARQGFRLIVVTNQQGIGKGRMTVETLNEIHAQMTRVLKGKGVVLDGIFHCPHREQEGCFCRKPRPGLIHRALNETPFLIDLSRSVLVGDSESDVLAGRAVGVRTVLVAKPGSQAAAAQSAATHVVGSLAEAVAAVTALPTTA